jgi:CRP/FNR family cyclic AMP-dependent transcriptional regulator
MTAGKSQAVAGRLDALHVANTIVRYKPCETVFAQGDRCAGVMYIRRGRVKLTVTSRYGRVAVVAILRAGSFFGEGVLAGQRLRRCNAETLMPSSIAMVKTRDMRRGLSETGVLSDWFRSQLLARNSRAESDLIEQLLNRSERRLARALLLLANFDAHYLPQAALPAISRDLLADMAGTTRSKVDVLMSKFRKLGFIARVDGGVQVHRSLLTIVTQE